MRHFIRLFVGLKNNLLFLLFSLLAFLFNMLSKIAFSFFEYLQVLTKLNFGVTMSH